MPDEKSEFESLVDQLTLRLLREYDKNVDSQKTSLATRAAETRETIASRLSGLAAEDEGILSFNKRGYEAIQQILGNLGSYLDLDAAGKRLLEDINSAIEPPKKHLVKRGQRKNTKASHEAREKKYTAADAVDAHNYLSSQEHYQTSGVDNIAVAGHIGLDNKHYGIIGSLLSRSWKKGNLPEYEQRDGRYFKIKPDDAPKGNNGGAPGGSPTPPQNAGGAGPEDIPGKIENPYTFPHQCPAIKNLETGGLLDRFYTGTFVRIQPGGTYNGHSDMDQRLRNIAGDIRNFMYSAGYKGRCDIETKPRQGTLQMSEETQAVFKQIIDARGQPAAK